MQQNTSLENPLDAINNPGASTARHLLLALNSQEISDQPLQIAPEIRQSLPTIFQLYLNANLNERMDYSLIVSLANGHLQKLQDAAARLNTPIDKNTTEAIKGLNAAAEAEARRKEQEKLERNSDLGEVGFVAIEILGVLRGLQQELYTEEAARRLILDGITREGQQKPGLLDQFVGKIEIFGINVPKISELAVFLEARKNEQTNDSTTMAATFVA